MSRRFLLTTVGVLLVGSLAVLLLHVLNDPDRAGHGAITESEIAELARKNLGQVAGEHPAPRPIDPARLVRLAMGNLGLSGEEQNRRAADLVLAQLTGAKGLELVERQELDVVLREMSLNMSGLVRAQDAIRVGKLVRADWFLLGSATSLNGTNYTVVRIVDARTGTLREADFFASGQASPRLASALAAFVQQCRQNATEAKSAVYLSVGSFEDLGVNSRQVALPSQLRSYLTAAYQGASVTMLEREFANTLLQELRLDLAGLTDEAGTNAPAMQSAYWMVDGYYQSYETAGLEVELVLNVQRMFGRRQQFTLRDQPGEPLFRQVKDSIEAMMQRNNSVLVQSRITELRSQLAAGKELFHAGPADGFGTVNLIMPGISYSQAHVEPARRQRNLEEAIRAFETVLLFDSQHREARIYLAACFRDSYIGRTDDARDIYAQIIESEVKDQWSELACKALAESFRREGSEEMRGWYQTAMQRYPNACYQAALDIEADKTALANVGSPEAEQVAERNLVEAARKWERSAQGGSWMLGFSHLGFKSFVEAYGTNQSRAAEQLAALLPRLLLVSSNLAPYLIAGVTAYQVDSNAPVIAQFEQSLAEAAARPENVFGAKKYFSLVSREVHNWAVGRGLYRLAALTKEVRARVAQTKQAEPLDDDDRMGLAFTYLKAEAWEPALEIFQSYSNRPVRRGFTGASKGAFMPVLTGQQANFCREKLGLPIVRDPREFEMGTNCLCLHTRSTFLTDSCGLWIGAGDELLRLDFDLKTNFAVRLPTRGQAPITVLCPGTSNIWIGTDGAGLIEFDKSTRQSRQLTLKEGLMMDSIASLHLAKDALWIGYGNARIGHANNQGGGLGRLDLTTHEAKSFTLSLAAGTEVHRHPSGNMVLEPADKPTVRSIHALASGPDGGILFATEFHPLRQYHPRKNVWAACPIGSGNCIVADTKRLFGGAVGSAAVLGVTAWDFESNKVWGFEASEGLPYQNVSTLCLDGQDLWIGGFGFVALADTADGKVRKYAYVPADTVDQIQIGGGHLWARYDGHLHRALLKDIR